MPATHLNRFIVLVLMLVSSGAQYVWCQPRFIVEPLDVSQAFSRMRPGVHAIAQDNQGAMWFACNEGGLIRYDGTSFRVINHTPQSIPRLSNHMIKDVIIDSLGHLWVSNNTGIDILEPGTLKILKTIHVAATDSRFMSFVQSLCLVRGTDVWAAAYNRGVIRYPNGDFEHPQIFDSIQLPNYINQAPDGKIWCISLPNRIYCWVNDHFERRYIKSEYLSRKATALLPIENEDGLLVGLRLLVSDQSRAVFKLDTGANNFIQGEPASGITLFSSPEIKLNLLKNTSPLTSPNLLHHPYKVFKDKQGTIWVAPGYGDIIKLKKAEMKFTVCPDLFGVSLRGMLETNNKYVYLATYSGLYQYAIATNKARLLPDPEREIFYHIAGIQHDTLSVFAEGTNYGSFILHPPYRFVSHLPDVVNIGPSLFTSMPLGGHWILGGSQQLFRINLSTRQIIPFCKLPTNPTTRIYAYQLVSDGHIWIGSTDGVFVIDKAGNSTAPTVRNNFRLGTDSQVNDIFEDRYGNLWFATRRYGLVKYNPVNEQIQYYDKNSGLACSEIYGIIGSHQDSLIWISTYAGLQCLNQFSGKTSLFTEADGTSGTEFNTCSFLQLSNGEVLMGGVGGLTRFNPVQYTPQPSVLPIPFISEVKIEESFSNHHTILNFPAGDSLIRLSTAENTLEFQYGCDYYFHSESNAYFVRLDGVDKDWVPMGGVTKIKYFRLPPGDYNFRVMIIIDNDKQNAEICSFAFQIEQVFYKKTWFVSLMIAMLTGLVLVVLWAIRQRQQREERIRQSIAKDLHSLLGGRITQMSNILYTVRSLHSNGQPIEEELHYLNEITRRAHGTLSDVIWVLAQKDELSNGLINRMEDYVDKWLRMSKIKVSFVQNISEQEAQIPVSTQHQLLLVFNEALSNIIKHSFPNEVKIRFWRNEDMSIELQIDNTFQERKTNAPSSGQGLTIMREQVAKMGGIITTKSGSNYFRLLVNFTLK